jgi:hypothetical protein
MFIQEEYKNVDVMGNEIIALPLTGIFLIINKNYLLTF